MREGIPLKEIKEGIESQKPPACFLFIAYELYLVEECIQKIKSQYIDKALEEFNFDLLRGWETTYAEICQRCLTLPMMSPHRMLLVKEADKIEDSNIDFLKDYLKHPSPTTILIFLYSSTSTKAAFGLLKRYGSIYYFHALPEKRLEEWIRSRLRHKGYHIEPGAIHYLLDQTGCDMIKIDNELKKIELTQAGQKQISLEDLQSLIGRSQRHSAFNLADAIGRKEIDKALRILQRLIEDGEEPLKILGALQYHFRQLIKFKHLLTHNFDDREIMNEMNLNKFNYKKLKEQGRLFSLSKLSYVFQSFCQTDLLLKSSQLKAQFHLEQLILNLVMEDDFLSRRKGMRRGS